jgi:Domain of unknown function (DUF3576)
MVSEMCRFLPRRSAVLLVRVAVVAALAVPLAGCGGKGIGGLFGKSNRSATAAAPTAAPQPPRESTIFDLFNNGDNPNITVEVNKYLWSASLEVLNFLPIESVDPFTGVIVTGFGTPPGGGRAYRATILVNDPALDARSLKVALVAQGGAVSAETVRAVEDAILTRARQLRVQDSKL